MTGSSRGGPEAQLGAARCRETRRRDRAVLRAGLPSHGSHLRAGGRCSSGWCARAAGLSAFGAIRSFPRGAWRDSTTGSEPGRVPSMRLLPLVGRPENSRDFVRRGWTSRLPSRAAQTLPPEIERRDRTRKCCSFRASRASRVAPDSGKAPETREKTRPRLLPVEIGQPAWRREWDSNPRYALTHTRFPTVRLKPLGHLSCCGSRARIPLAVGGVRSEPVSSPRCGYCPSSAAQRTRGIS